MVLVVDDDPDIRSLIQGLLEDEGLSVSTAADGRQALDCVERARPALIVLDLGLPLLSGEQVASRLQHLAGAPPPIILISAAGNLAEVARRVGAIGYLRKPFDLDELLGAVHQGLNHSW
jgi:DNA-binding response OmpR family regulator